MSWPAWLKWTTCEKGDVWQISLYMFHHWPLPLSCLLFVELVGPRGTIHVNHLQAPCGAFLRWDLSWHEMLMLLIPMLILQVSGSRLFAVGVVHPYLDQKLLKSNKIKSFNPGPKIGSRYCSNEYKCTNITTPAYAIMSLRPPNTIYTYLSQALLFRLICHTPIKNRGLSVDPDLFLRFWRWKHQKKTL